MQQETTVWETFGARRGTFVVATFVVFALSSAGLFSVGFVPVSPSAVASEADAEETPTVEEDTSDRATPRRIVIDKIGVDSEILAPESADVDVLDEALLDGVVHYPGSGTLADDENMLLFGHSSYLPIIHNKAYKAFNDIQKLVPGDVIRVQSETEEHLYRVREVRQAPASEVMVRFDTGKKQLTLSTCNSFGDKSDRFIVEADFVSTYEITD